MIFGTFIFSFKDLVPTFFIDGEKQRSWHPVVTVLLYLTVTSSFNTRQPGAESNVNIFRVSDVRYNVESNNLLQHAKMLGGVKNDMNTTVCILNISAESGCQMPEHGDTTNAWYTANNSGRVTHPIFSIQKSTMKVCLLRACLASEYNSSFGLFMG